MKEHFRKQIRGQVAKEYGFNDPDVTFRSFFRFNSFKNPVAACDIVNAAAALVEVCRTVTVDASGATGAADKDAEDAAEASRIRAFDEAYDCLGMKDEDTLKKGLQLSISLQKMIVRKASGLLEDFLHIQKLKNLYFVSVSNSAGVGAGGGGGVSEPVAGTGSSNASGPSGGSGGGNAGNNSGKVDESEVMDSPFSRPMVLARLGQYIMDVKMSMSKRDGGYVI